MRSLKITENGKSQNSDLFLHSTPHRFDFGADNRIAIWMRDEEHDWRTIHFADAMTGAIDISLDDVAPEYGGTILLRCGGTRLFHQNLDSETTWGMRQFAAGQWGSSILTASALDAERLFEEFEQNYRDISLSVSPDCGTVVIAVTIDEEIETLAGHLEVWQIDDAGNIENCQSPLVTSQLPSIFKTAVPPGGCSIVVAATELPQMPYIVWDWRNGQKLAELEADAKRVWKQHLAFSPDGSYLAAMMGWQIFIWETQSWKKIHELQHDGPCEDFAFAPDSRSLLVGQKSGTVHVWNLPSGEREKSFVWKRGSPGTSLLSVAYAPDGLTCLAGFDSSEVVIWDCD